MQRAAAKSQMVRLGKVAQTKLKNFKNEKLKSYREIAAKRQSSQEVFGGARTQ